MTRELTEPESEALAFLLSLPDPRLDALREQSRAVRVASRWECCPSIDLIVDRAGLRPASGLRGLAVQAQQPIMDRFREPLDLLLFVVDGWLSMLELVHYVEPAPDEFPPVSIFGTP